MSDSTSNIDQLALGQGNLPTRINETQDALSPAALYGRRASTSANLTWGYYGGRFNSALINNGTVTLTASSTNYLVASRADGSVSVDTATTDWNDTAAFVRLHKVVAGVSTVTSWEDHRQAIGGSSGSGGSGVASVVAGSGITVDNTDPANPVVSASGGGGALAPVVTESGTSLLAIDADAGNYTRFTGSSPKTYEFDSAETYTTAAEFNGRNVGTGDLTLTEVGSFVLNAPAGGSLVVPPGGTFTVKIVGASEADVFGVTS